MIGKKIHNLASLLWPITRSIAGPGNLKSLKILKKINPSLKIKGYPCGKKVFDWKIPHEWIIKDAYIKNKENKKILDFKDNNLHVVNFSRSIHQNISLDKLKKKIFTIKKNPTAIPYVTSYYHKTWGFCMSYKQYKSLKDKTYFVKIDSKFKKGKLNYGEIFIKGKSKKEILISTYICHPSMANNELSGPCLSIFLSNWINSKKRRYSYRFLFLPETIGSISYIFHNLNKLKKNVISGMIVTCVGDEKNFSFLPSKNQNSILDKIIKEELIRNKISYKNYSWLQRGSDERQFNWPNIDLEMSSLMRSKYHEYKEYHTSHDDLKKVVTPKGLNETYNIYLKIFLNLEKKFFPVSNNYCEPMLSKKNLYPKIGYFNQANKKKNLSKLVLNILSYSDGKNSIEDIAYKCQINKNYCSNLINYLNKKKLISLF